MDSRSSSKWENRLQKLNTIRTATRPYVDEGNEGQTRGWERPRQDDKSRLRPDPPPYQRPQYPYYPQYQSDPGPQATYPSGNGYSPPQTMSPEPSNYQPHGQHQGGGYSQPGYSASSQPSPYQAPAPFYPPQHQGYAPPQGYIPQGSSQGTFQVGQSYQSQAGIPYSSYPHTQNANPTSSNPHNQGYSQPPPSQAYSQSYQTQGQNPTYGQSSGASTGSALNRSATTPEASLCEHGRLDDGSCRECIQQTRKHRWPLHR